jgi:hypothetical protein
LTASRKPKAYLPCQTGLRFSEKTLVTPPRHPGGINLDMQVLGFEHASLVTQIHRRQHACLGRGRSMAIVATPSAMA